MGFVGFRTFGWFLTNDLWLYAICAVEDEDTDKGAFEPLFLFSGDDDSKQGKDDKAHATVRTLCCRY